MAKVKIPKIIHFIWVGGALKHTQLYWISHWARQNSGYSIWVWYDTRHLLANVVRKKVAGDQVIRQHVTAARYLGGDKGRRDFLDEYNIMTPADAKAAKQELKSAWNVDAQKIFAVCPNISLKNVKTDLGGLTNQHLYDLELNDWGGNMAAASDILRVEIILKFGGIYLDIDLECKKPLDSFKVRSDLALFGNWPGPNGPRMNNAIIAAAPKAAILQEYRDHQANFFKNMQTSSLPNYLQGMFANMDTQSLPQWVSHNSAFCAGVPNTWLHDETKEPSQKSRRELAITRSTGPGAALTVAGVHFVQSAQKGQRSFEEEFLFPQGYVNFDTPAQRVSSTRNDDL